MASFKGQSMSNETSTNGDGPTCVENDPNWLTLDALKTLTGIPESSMTRIRKRMGHAYEERRGGRVRVYSPHWRRIGLLINPRKFNRD